MARHAGATVFAVLLTDPMSPARLAPVARRLGAAGADKVLVGEAAGFGSPALDATHGHALHVIAERVAPLIVLFPAGGPGPELAAPLAMRLGGAFGGCSDLVLCDDEAALPEGAGRVGLRRWRGGWSGCRLLDPVEIERPVVAILGATGRAADAGDDEVEVEIVTCPPPSESAVTELSSEPDELAALELARTVVVVDSDVYPAALEALAAAPAAGVAVLDRKRVRPAALAHATPAAALFIGKQAAPFSFGTPAMRVGLVAPAEPPPGDGGIDALWLLPADGQVEQWAGLARALPALGDGGTEPDRS